MVILVAIIYLLQIPPVMANQSIYLAIYLLTDVTEGFSQIQIMSEGGTQKNNL